MTGANKVRQFGLWDCEGMRVGKAIPKEEQCVSRSPSAENIQATVREGTTRDAYF